MNCHLQRAIGGFEEVLDIICTLHRPRVAVLHLTESGNVADTELHPFLHSFACEPSTVIFSKHFSFGMFQFPRIWFRFRLGIKH
jgi:hypothetical protein